MNYDWDFSVLKPYAGVFLRGAGVTLLLSFVVIIVGTIVGFGTGLMLRTRLRPARLLVSLVVDAVRSLPPLILILWFYYFLPALLGLGHISSFTLGAIALSVNLAAFVADVVRGAIGNVPAAYTDAAASLGMSRVQILRRIVVPEVVYSTLPTISMLYIAVLKLSALVSVIACYELTHSAKGVLTETLRAPEVYTVIAVIYLALIMPLSAVARRFERRLDAMEKVTNGVG
jgi:polar amino acid transport system permease protein